MILLPWAVWAVAVLVHVYVFGARHDYETQRPRLLLAIYITLICSIVLASYGQKAPAVLQMFLGFYDAGMLCLHDYEAVQRRRRRYRTGR